MTTAALPPRRNALWIRLGVLAAVAAAALAFARLVPLPDLPLCMFRLWTGRPCPGCGMTRAIVHLAQGDVPGSLRYHPLGVVLAAIVMAAAAATAIGIARGDDPVMRLLERRGTQLAAGLFVVFAGLWIVRAFVVPSWSPDPVGEPGGFALPFLR